MALRFSATVTFLVFMLVAGSCQGEHLVAMTQPAPALLGFDASLAASTQYYISYGSLDANRAPCPAGTGRSYYTQSCQGSGAVQPYVRSCNQITRCARG